ncbi:MAG: L-seryl-tRNA(Sec) selenium transferase [Acidobacteriota bacterium]|nr:L-seryl-tRNA(Sec) selenium transferase [Acidobacteriota bacterium]MDH3528791.1 L-seryl-tRNA(Sec) selenium transferase [Acidobacteriota bacterium]
MDNVADKTTVLRNLPGIDTLLRSEVSARLLGAVGSKHLTGLARLVTDSLRLEIEEEIGSGRDINPDSYSAENLLKEAEIRLENAWTQEQNTSLQHVINASGVIVHTNLGRAPLSEAARKAMFEEATRYCNLEYNIETGKRGKRGARAEHLLADITGAESALIVNNCAAACVLVLTALAKGGESIISRGELVEIGGDFRVPDVMKESGTVLVEVGTTNKTKAADYEHAVTENTRLITRVHPSNYRIVGFTAKPTVADLAAVAHRNGILLYEDAGSGAIADMSQYGLTDEPVIGDSIRDGADVVTFSGDKLIGGIQSGLIVGRGEVIEQIRKHPLYRALRVSKLVYAVLEATLESFRRGEAVSEVPVLRMLSMSKAELKDRTWHFAHKLRERIGENSHLKFEIGEGNSVVGGGSAPAIQPRTILVALSHPGISASGIEERLRCSKPPVISRIFNERVAIDLRTVLPDEEEALVGAVAALDEVMG